MDCMWHEAQVCNRKVDEETKLFGCALLDIGDGVLHNEVRSLVPGS